MPSAANVEELLTPRLRLRGWRREDEPAMAAINRDPEVTRYLNGPVGEQATASFLADVTEHWDRHGFGFYAIERRDGDPGEDLLGFVGCAYPTFIPELAHRPELGWRLARRAWGGGIATEAATAVRDRALIPIGHGELISIIHPENQRSQRVAMKLGMTLAEQVRNPTLERDVEVWSLRS